MNEMSAIKECLVRMIDFAYAIGMDEKSPNSGGIALTMSEAIQDYGAKALEIMDAVETSHI